MNIAMQKAVRDRAGNRCEYCLLPEEHTHFRFCNDHIIAQQHQGATTLENLAFACPRCNLHKGPNLAGIDPESETLAPLFNPRTDRWIDHFREVNGTIEGMTAIGRATVRVLDMNNEDRVRLRRELIQLRLWKSPPESHEET